MNDTTFNGKGVMSQTVTTVETNTEIALSSWQKKPVSGGSNSNESLQTMLLSFGLSGSKFVYHGWLHFRL